MVYAGDGVASFHSTYSDILQMTLGYYYKAAFTVTCVFQPHKSERFFGLHEYFFLGCCIFSSLSVECPMDENN
jgi:hypothetical protein